MKGNKRKSGDLDLPLPADTFALTAGEQSDSRQAQQDHTVIPFPPPSGPPPGTASASSSSESLTSTSPPTTVITTHSGSGSGSSGYSPSVMSPVSPHAPSPTMPMPAPHAASPPGAYNQPQPPQAHAPYANYGASDAKGYGMQPAQPNYPMSGAGFGLGREPSLLGGGGGFGGRSDWRSSRHAEKQQRREEKYQAKQQRVAAVTGWMSGSGAGSAGKMPDPESKAALERYRLVIVPYVPGSG